MIKVQSLRLRGLVASSLLALAACSGTPSGQVDPAADGGAKPLADNTAGKQDAKPQDPQAQNPQGQGRDNKPIIAKTLESARNSLKLGLFEDARNSAAWVLEMDTTNQEARDIVQRCNQLLGDDHAAGGLRPMLEDTIIRDGIARERERTNVENDLRGGRAHMELGQYGRAID